MIKILSKVIFFIKPQSLCFGFTKHKIRGRYHSSPYNMRFIGQCSVCMINYESYNCSSYSRSQYYWEIDNKIYNKSSYYKLIEEIRDMPLVMRLTDPRQWVREWKD